MTVPGSVLKVDEVQSAPECVYDEQHSSKQAALWPTDYRGVLWSFIVIWAVIRESNKSESRKSFWFVGSSQNRDSATQQQQSVGRFTAERTDWAQGVPQRGRLSNLFYAGRVTPFCGSRVWHSPSGPSSSAGWWRMDRSRLNTGVVHNCCHLSFSCRRCQTIQRWPTSEGSVGPFISITWIHANKVKGLIHASSSCI